MSYFGRVVEVAVAGLEFRSPPFAVEVDSPFGGGRGGAADVTRVEIRNLSDASIAKLELGAPVVVRAGYEGDVGTLAVGTISEVKTRWEGTEKKTSVLVGDGTAKWLTARLNRTWRAGAKASEIARDVVRVLGLDVGKIDLPSDVDYPSGRTFVGPAKDALLQLAADSGARLHVSRQAVYLVPPERSVRVGVVLSPESGLLDSPEPISDAPGAYRIRALLQHRITTDALVELRTRHVRGDFRVLEGRHKGGEGEHITTAMVVPA